MEAKWCEVHYNRVNMGKEQRKDIQAILGAEKEKHKNKMQEDLMQLVSAEGKMTQGLQGQRRPRGLGAAPLKGTNCGHTVFHMESRPCPTVDTDSSAGCVTL